MTERTHEQYAEDIGAYVLGALSELEASALSRHAATCATCHAEIETLRGAAEALPLSVTPANPSSELKRSLMRTVSAEARGRPGVRRPRLPAIARLRPAMAWVSAAFLLAVGIAAGAFGVTALNKGDGRELAADVDPKRAPGASATLVAPEDEDEAAVLRVRGLTPALSNEVYQVWTRHGKEVVPGALFTPRSDGTGAAAIPEGLDGVDEVMVTRERAGGARVPSERLILSVRT